MKATIKIELRKDYATIEGKQMVCLRYTAYRRSTLISMNIAVLPKHWIRYLIRYVVLNPIVIIITKLSAKYIKRLIRIANGEFLHSVTYSSIFGTLER